MNIYNCGAVYKLFFLLLLLLSTRISGLAVFAECVAGGWLAEISADVREAIAC